MRSAKACFGCLVPTVSARRYTQMQEARHFGRDAEIQAMDGN